MASEYPYNCVAFCYFVKNYLVQLTWLSHVFVFTVIKQGADKNN
jgi:hypothetical protein